MPRTDRISKIKYQFRKGKAESIASTWKSTSYLVASQGTLNALVPDNLNSLIDDEFPVVFLDTELDWMAGADDDTIVKIRKGDVYVVQDLTQPNIPIYEFVTSPNIGMGYFGKSYYGGAL